MTEQDNTVITSTTADNSATPASPSLQENPTDENDDDDDVVETEETGDAAMTVVEEKDIVVVTPKATAAAAVVTDVVAAATKAAEDVIMEVLGDKDDETKSASNAPPSSPSATTPINIDYSTERQTLEEAEAANQQQVLLECAVSGDSSSRSVDDIDTKVTTKVTPKAEAATELKSPPPLNIFQQRAANVLRNFQTGLQIQQQQQQQQRKKSVEVMMIRQKKVLQEKNETKKKEGATTTDDEVKTEQAVVAKTTVASTTKTTTTKGVTSTTPTQNEAKSNAELSSNRSVKSTDSSAKKQSASIITKPSPTGVLDLPALFKSASSLRPTTPVVSLNIDEDEEDSAQDTSSSLMKKKQKEEDLDVPTLQTQTSSQDSNMSPPGESNSKSSFWSSLMKSSVISPTNADDNDNDDTDVAHQFQPHTYHTPTQCDMCDGLLVGLWKQGLQCQLCHMNVHRGEGSNGHTNCRAEALLQDGGCRKHSLQCCSKVIVRETVAKEVMEGDDDATQATANLSDAIQQVRQLAKDKPNFFRDVKAQMDRDLQSRVKSIIVSKGTEEQKSKSLLRLRTNIVVPTVALLDSIEQQQDGGWKCAAYGILGVLHVMTATTVFVSCYLALSVAMMYNNSTCEKFHHHLAAILYAFHVAQFLMILVIRRLVIVMHRKSKVLDQFLQEVFSLNAESDLGISIQQFATRARLWMKRSTATAAGMVVLSLVVYRWTTMILAVVGRGNIVADAQECLLASSEMLAT